MYGVSPCSQWLASHRHATVQCQGVCTGRNTVVGRAILPPLSLRGQASQNEFSGDIATIGSDILTKGESDSPRKQHENPTLDCLAQSTEFFLWVVMGPEIEFLRVVVEESSETVAAMLAY